LRRRWQKLVRSTINRLTVSVLIVLPHSNFVKDKRRITKKIAEIAEERTGKVGIKYHPSERDEYIGDVAVREVPRWVPVEFLLLASGRVNEVHVPKCSTVDRSIDWIDWDGEVKHIE